MDKKTRMKTILIILAAILVPAWVSAATVWGGKEFTLGKNETIDDNLYVGASDVTVSGEVKNDLLAAGGIVLLTGTVGEDATLAGGNVDVLGEVRGDLRLAGGQLTIGKNVGGDLAMAGGNAQVLPEVTVGKDMLIGAGNAVLSGTVNGDVRGGGGTVTINGTVHGDVILDVSQKLILGRNAILEGDLQYRSPIKAEIAEGAAIQGEITYVPLRMKNGTDGGRQTLAGAINFFHLSSLAAALIVGLVLALYFKPGLDGMMRTISAGFGQELVRGLVVAVVSPIAILILFATIIGWIAGLTALLAYLILLIISNVLAGLIFGSLLAKYWYKKGVAEVTWKNALGGIIILAILGYIPLIGWLAWLVFFLVALGVLSSKFWQKIKS